MVDKMLNLTVLVSRSLQLISGTRYREKVIQSANLIGLYSPLIIFNRPPCCSDYINVTRKRLRLASLP